MSISNEELKIIQSSATIGYEITSEIEDRLIRDLSTEVLQLREKLAIATEALEVYSNRIPFNTIISLSECDFQKEFGYGAMATTALKKIRGGG